MLVYQRVPISGGASPAQIPSAFILRSQFHSSVICWGSRWLRPCAHHRAIAGPWHHGSSEVAVVETYWNILKNSSNSIIFHPCMMENHGIILVYIYICYIPMNPWIPINDIGSFYPKKQWLFMAYIRRSSVSCNTWGGQISLARGHCIGHVIPGLPFGKLI